MAALWSPKLRYGRHFLSCYPQLAKVNRIGRQPQFSPSAADEANLPTSGAKRFANAPLTASKSDCLEGASLLARQQSSCCISLCRGDMPPEPFANNPGEYPGSLWHLESPHRGSKNSTRLQRRANQPRLTAANSVRSRSTFKGPLLLPRSGLGSASSLILSNKTSFRKSDLVLDSERREFALLGVHRRCKLPGGVQRGDTAVRTPALEPEVGFNPD